MHEMLTKCQEAVIEPRTVQHSSVSYILFLVTLPRLRIILLSTGNTFCFKWVLYISAALNYRQNLKQ